MRNLSLMVLIFSFSSITASPAIAADAGAKIDIVSPADGSRIEALVQHKLAYEVTLEGSGDHAHLYVDGKETTLLRQTKGSVTLDPLAPGAHEICAKMVNKNHTPIGVERCIKVKAE